MIEQATMTAEQRLQKEVNEKLAAEAEVRKLRAELNTARAQALNGTGREAELERQMALQLEEERERRVQHLGQLGIKRMMNHKLSLCIRVCFGPSVSHITGMDSAALPTSRVTQPTEQTSKQSRATKT